MRKITLDNYEEFFLDFLEGNLNEEENLFLEGFLLQYPQLRVELEEMDLLVLTPEQIKFNKEILYNTPYQNDFENYCVAKLEGDLSSIESKGFNNFLSTNQVYNQNWQTYQKTILVPDFTINYPNKRELYKNRKLTAFWLTGIGIAASILISFAVWNTNSNNLKHDKEIVKSHAFGNIDFPKEIAERKASLLNTTSSTKDISITAKAKVVKNFVPPTTVSESNITQIERVSVPELREVPLEKLLANNSPEIGIVTPNNNSKSASVFNAGLDQLGMSWKSSMPKKKSKNTLLYAVAKYGVNKLSEIAGKKIQVQKKYDSETEKTRLSFNSTGLGFSTTVK